MSHYSQSCELLYFPLSKIMLTLFQAFLSLPYLFVYLLLYSLRSIISHKSQFYEITIVIRCQHMSKCPSVAVTMATVLWSLSDSRISHKEPLNSTCRSACWQLLKGLNCWNIFKNFTFLVPQNNFLLPLISSSLAHY